MDLTFQKVAEMTNVPVYVHEGELEATSRWYDNAHCPNGRSTHSWTHDGSEELIAEEVLEKPTSNFGGGGQKSFCISGATYAILTGTGRNVNGTTWHQVHKAIVWPKCDPMELLDALAPLVFGGSANARYVLAKHNFAAARAWIVDNLTIQANDESLYMRINDVEYMPGAWCRQDPEVIRNLVQVHGVELLEPWFAERQRWFLRAKKDIEQAVSYLLRYYTVKVKDGELCIGHSEERCYSWKMQMVSHWDHAALTLDREHGSLLIEALIKRLNQQ